MTAVVSTVLFSASTSVVEAQTGCLGPPATIIGTDDADFIVGTDGDDVIVARGGDDLVVGLDGDDIICLGEGNDRGLGQKGEDSILGENGNDVLSGGNRGDFLDGGAGTDTLRGNNGTDTLIGGIGDDVLIGGRNSDVIEGGLGDDELRGGRAPDVITGGEGNDVILGGRGGDDIDGGPGNDVLDGGLGNDEIFAFDDEGDRIDDRDNIDTCIFDPFDLGKGCDGGFITALSGSGDGGVIFDSATIAPFEFGVGFPAGPYFVLQYEAIARPGEAVVISVFDDSESVLEVFELPAGVEGTSGNVIVRGVPAEVFISGASDWHLGIVDGAAFQQTYETVFAGGANIIPVLNDPNGTSTDINLTNVSSVGVTYSIIGLGEDGIFLLSDGDLPAGESALEEGVLFPDISFVAVFAPGIEWTLDQTG